MTSLDARRVLCAFGLCCLSVGSALGQGYGSPSLLDRPGEYAYPITQTGYRAPNNEDTLVSPSDAPMPMAPMQSGPMMAQPQATTPMANDYQRAMSHSWSDPGHAAAPAYAAGSGYSAGLCDSGSCDAGDCIHGGCRRGAWFGYVGGLYMQRENCTNVPLAYNSLSGITNLTTGMADMQGMGGFETSFGKWFCGCNVGIEAVYWGLFPQSNSYSLTGSVAAGYPTGWQQYTGIAYDPGTGPVPYGTYWTNAPYQIIRRDWDIQNVEVNLIGNAWNTGGCGGGCGYGGSCGGCNSGCGAGYSPLTVGWLGGFRYFEFSDNFFYASDNLDATLDGDPNEVSYTNQIKNQMFGFQMGGYMSYQVGCRWSVYGGAKAGVFNNHTSMFKRLYGTNGDAYINNGGPYQGQALNYRSQYDALAMMAQLDVGARWQMSCHWAARFGYRVVGVSGVATVEDQFQQNYNDYAGFTNTNCGSLLLHGAYAGVEFCW